MLRRMTVRLSASLHAELAERVFAYVRGASQEGWAVRPVSAHLHTIAPRVVDAPRLLPAHPLHHRRLLSLDPHACPSTEDGTPP